MAACTTLPITPVSSSPRRFKNYFQDDAVCKRSQETVQQLLTSAMDESSTSSTSNSALLAKKALKYRKVYERMAGVDVNAPEFDASSFLGHACIAQYVKAINKLGVIVAVHDSEEHNLKCNRNECVPYSTQFRLPSLARHTVNTSVVARPRRWWLVIRNLVFQSLAKVITRLCVDAFTVLTAR